MLMLNIIVGSLPLPIKPRESVEPRNTRDANSFLKIARNTIQRNNPVQGANAKKVLVETLLIV